MKIIHCSLWGDIEVSDIALKIIDCPFFQRLHYIRQNGFAYKVFPTVSTTRFAHSLGVYHVTKMLLSSIKTRQPEVFQNIEGREELICIAGLIHDIGHGPFSHWFDQFLEKVGIEHRWSDHENRSVDIFRHVVETFGIPLDIEQVGFITKILSETSDLWYCNIIKNHKISIDTDKMDYLLRDCQAFGLHMKFDVHRIICNTRIIENDICFCDRIENEIENLFYIRNKMYSDIYFHKTIQKFDEMAILLIKDVNEIKNIVTRMDFDRFLDLTDDYILSRADRKCLRDFDCRRWPAGFEICLRLFHDSQLQLLENVRFYRRGSQQLTSPL